MIAGHPPVPAEPAADGSGDYKGAVQRVTIVSAMTNLALAVIKVVAGLLAGSQALIADGIHSVSDLVTDAIVWLAAHFAAQPPDEDHPYGHGRFETVATVLLSAVLVTTGGAIIVHAVASFSNSEVPESYAFIVALISIAANEGLYQYNMRVGRRIRSSLLIANAWHNRSDAGSSVASALGVLGARLGFPMLDPVAALLVGLMVARMGLEIGWKSVEELLDSSLEEQLLKDLGSRATTVEGVLSVHALRARRMGPNILVDLHIDVPGSMTVLEAHELTEDVEKAILDRFDAVSEVLVHVDPIELPDEQRAAEIGARVEPAEVPSA